MRLPSVEDDYHNIPVMNSNHLDTPYSQFNTMY